MNQFYSAEIFESTATLTESECQHLRVLRYKIGDELMIVDGQGKQFRGTVQSLQKKTAIVEDLQLTRSSLVQPALDIAIAPTKSNDRFEWFLEKATELGVRNIYSFTSYHSERKIIKTERMQKVILSAMKQSLRLWLPKLHDIQTFRTILEQTGSEHKFIAHLGADTLHLKDGFKGGNEAIVLIGPEGGFSKEEIQGAKKAGYKSVTLGDFRYRTETAGILCAALFANS